MHTVECVSQVLCCVVPGNDCPWANEAMGLLPDTWNCGLRMRRECRERFPRHQLQRKPLVSNPGMHHGTCVTHVPWCMSGSLTCGGRGKRSRHSRRMRNPQFYVSGKRPIGKSLGIWLTSNNTKVEQNSPICSMQNLSLTHWGRDRMAAILQTAHSNAFPLMFEFR